MPEVEASQVIFKINIDIHKVRIIKVFFMQSNIVGGILLFVAAYCFVTDFLVALYRALSTSYIFFCSNECIYCEKRFSDRNTLMDHMRKRNHKEVNPKNNYYDKFYIINYLVGIVFFPYWIFYQLHKNFLTAYWYGYSKFFIV